MLTRRLFAGRILCATGALLTAGCVTQNEDREVINARVNLALGKMWARLPQTRKLSSKARAMLVMPDVVKAGLIAGGAYGEGALLLNDEVLGYESPAQGPERTGQQHAAGKTGDRLRLRAGRHPGWRKPGRRKILADHPVAQMAAHGPFSERVPVRLFFGAAVVLRSALRRGLPEP